MKILLLDDDEILLQGLDYINSINNEYTYMTLKDLDIKENRFKDIDLVIVDFEIDEYFSVFKEIIEYDKSKKIIVASEKLSSCIDEDCEFCMESYNIRRLIKPIEFESLFSLMDSSFEDDCIYYKSFLDMAGVLPCIIKRFSSLSFDEKSNAVYVQNTIPSNIYTYELISLVNILEQNSINYSIVDDKKIQIL